jgi:hypothetical protein
MTEAEAREAARLAHAAAGITTRLEAVEQALRSRTRIILVVGVLIGLVGLYMIISQQQAATQREYIVRTLQEVKDCTTPDVPSDCQKRIQASQAQRSVVGDLKADNIRASVAVGLCLQADDPDLLSCALAKAEELRPKTPPP